MHLEPWADFCLIFFGGFFAIVTVGLLGATAFALNKLVNALDKLVDKVDPVISKATDVIETVQRVATNVGEKADHILTKGEALTDDVTNRVERTAGTVQKSVTEPLIKISSLITGVSKGISVYTGSSNGSSKQRLKVPSGRPTEERAKVYNEDGVDKK